jgi:hypothetical protein
MIVVYTPCWLTNGPQQGCHEAPRRLPLGPQQQPHSRSRLACSDRAGRWQACLSWASPSTHPVVTWVTGTPGTRWVCLFLEHNRCAQLAMVAGAIPAHWPPGEGFLVKACSAHIAMCAEVRQLVLPCGIRCWWCFGSVCVPCVEQTMLLVLTMSRYDGREGSNGWVIDDGPMGDF